MQRLVLMLLSVSIPAFAAENTSPAPIDLDAARRTFQEAQALCTADGGKFWGISLCGPMMFSDPESREIVANQKDSEGVLKESNGVFVGTLPVSLNISSTPTEWSGMLWTQIVWPTLPEDAPRRHTLLAHELFHRIQSRVPIPPQEESPNEHLDTLEGRYLMQLEWRALAAALRCKPRQACRQAVADALLFRAARYRLFPEAAAQEKSLELNEGIAEYTGVSVGNRTRQGRIEVALGDLSLHVGDKTFVRSFAYATGPAYGLLLDEYSPGWKQQLRSAPSLNDLLQSAAHIHLPQDLNAAEAARAQHYDGAALRSVELEREKNRQQILAANKAKFIDGPVLVIPLRHANIQFDPRSLQPMEKLGTVYPTMRVSAAFGVLEVQNGALLRPDWGAVTLVAPNEAAGTKGDGWTLDLKPNWKIIPGERGGDFILTGPTQ